jgi:hypothetical protein
VGLGRFTQREFVTVKVSDRLSHAKRPQTARKFQATKPPGSALSVTWAPAHEAVRDQPKLDLQREVDMLQYDLTAQKATALDTERSLRLSLKRVQLENAVLTVQRDQGEKSIQQWLYKEMEWSEQHTQTADRIRQLEATLQERDDSIW